MLRMRGINPLVSLGHLPAMSLGIPSINHIIYPDYRGGYLSAGFQDLFFDH
jgi:hypothetical protein